MHLREEMEVPDMPHSNDNYPQSEEPSTVTWVLMVILVIIFSIWVGVYYAG